MNACASQLRCLARSIGGGARGAGYGLHGQAVLAQGGELDEEVERGADLLSEPGEHAFGKVRRGSDGKAHLLQLCLQQHYAPRVPEPFRHRIRVRFNECDGQGVVFYANYLVYFDLAMTELWREAFGNGYAGMIENGTDAMVAEANIRYHASARFDDELDLVAEVTRIGTTSSTTRLRAERVSDGQTLAEADIRHVFIDAATLEKTEIPGEVRTGMERYAG